MSRARREREKSEDKTPSGATRLWKGLDETCWAVCDLPSPSGVGKHIPGIYYLRGTILIRTHHAPKTRTPSDSQYKQGLDKMRCNSGLSNSFSERFFFLLVLSRPRAKRRTGVFFITHKKKSSFHPSTSCSSSKPCLYWEWEGVPGIYYDKTVELPYPRPKPSPITIRLKSGIWATFSHSK